MLLSHLLCLSRLENINFAAFDTGRYLAGLAVESAGLNSLYKLNVLCTTDYDIIKLAFTDDAINIHFTLNVSDSSK